MLPEKLYAIVGHPLGHSLSPALHSWAFDAVGWPGIYMAFPQEPENLAGFFAAVRSLPLQGGNITVPFKVDAMSLVDEVSDAAARIGAINTFYWKDGRLCGENTDVLGFRAPLEGKTFRQAVILGAGGVSRAAIVALQSLGIPQISITNRSPERAQKLADEFGIQCVPWNERGDVPCDLLVNATSLGMKGRNEDLTPYPAASFAGRTGVAYDIVYTPEKTCFLRDAEAAGWQIQSGVAMFVEQARAAFALWTGKEMPEEGAYSLVRSALGLKG